MVACTGVNVLYKRSDLQKTLLERLSQTMWFFRGHGQMMLLKGPLTKETIPWFPFFCRQC
jgi:hypothetical protein